MAAKATTTTKTTSELKEETNKLSQRISHTVDELHLLKSELESLRNNIRRDFELIHKEFENVNKYLTKKLS